MLPVDPLRDLPGYALRRASAAAMQRFARRLAQLDLRPTEASVLMVIESNPNITRAKKAMKSHEEELLTRIPAGHRAAFLAALHALWDVNQ